MHFHHHGLRNNKFQNLQYQKVQFIVDWDGTNAPMTVTLSGTHHSWTPDYFKGIGPEPYVDPNDPTATDRYLVTVHSTPSLKQPPPDPDTGDDLTTTMTDSTGVLRSTGTDLVTIS